MSGVPLVRLAELSIDPAQLDAYRSLLAEEIEASIRMESGVLALHAVSLKHAPHQVRLLEVYANQDVYRAHVNSPHFLKYKSATAGMVVSLTLLDAAAICLAAKSGFGRLGN